MPTKTKEHYLKAIYFLGLNEESITVTALGEIMGVSKPTVNNMVKKLTATGWIEYIKYKPIKLTKKGELDAAMIVRKHRLTEMFLVQIMGFGWEEVHDIAEEMEHLKTEQLFDRMDDILGYPTSDPHGSPIPDKQGVSKRKAYQVMAQYQVNDVVLLRAVGDSSVSLLNLLNEKKIRLGTEFHIHKIESFDNTMTVSYEGVESVTLSYEVTKRLLVEQKS